MNSTKYRRKRLVIEEEIDDPQGDDPADAYAEEG